ncbi:MAG TPA: hypothetical protein VKE50_03475 [Thermoanaerobaculia bacterium]|nr:hypothetical protein [Thermoanaerobaculia bacterium]
MDGFASRRRIGAARAVLIALAAAAGAPAASAESPVVGQLLSQALTPLVLPAGATTVVDLASPASAAGSFTSATVQWSGGGISGCSPGFKLKFFRPSPSGAVLAYLGERGPFPAVRSLLVVSLSPPMALQARDLIGVAELGGSACGGVGSTVNETGIQTVLFAGDVTSNRSMSDAMSLVRGTLSARATAGDLAVRIGVVPVVLAAAGQFGSVFRTEVQLTNPAPYSIRGRLVFHPQLISASSSDPALDFDLNPGETVSFADVVGALSASGVGSLDVVSIESPPPWIVARVFNDAGAAGTTGFTEPAVPAAEALEQFDTARFTTPADPAHYRMNVGVRTFADGAFLTITRYSAAGAVISTVTRAYPPEYLVQVSLSDFLGSAASASESFSVLVNSGSAVVYAATADNRTNDSSVQIGNRRNF